VGAPEVTIKSLVHWHKAKVSGEKTRENSKKVIFRPLFCFRTKYAYIIKDTTYYIVYAWWSELLVEHKVNKFNVARIRINASNILPILFKEYINIRIRSNILYGIRITAFSKLYTFIACCKVSRENYSIKYYIYIYILI